MAANGKDAVSLLTADHRKVPVQIAACQPTNKEEPRGPGSGEGI
jgi:hypothetical protein